MLIKILALFGFILLSSIANAEDYEVVYLPRDKSISTVMFDRGIEPIYGKRGALYRVLELNNLTEKEARKLPLNFPIKFPDFRKLGMVKNEAPEAVDDEAVVETTETSPEVIQTKNTYNALTADLGYYIYRGSIKGSNSDFNAYGGFIKTSFMHELKWDDYSILIYPSASFYKFEKISSDYLVSYGLDLVGRKLIANKYLGLGLTYHNLFYITGKNSRPDSIDVAVPGLFLEAGHQFPELEFNVRVGANLPAKKDSEEISTSPFARLLVMKSLSDRFRLRISSEYEHRTLNSETQSFFTFGGGILYQY